MFLYEMQSIDIVFTVVVGGLLLLLLVFLLIKKITDRKVKKALVAEMDRLKNEDSAAALANVRKVEKVEPVVKQVEEVEQLSLKEEIVENQVEEDQVEPENEPEVVEETPEVVEVKEECVEEPVVEQNEEPAVLVETAEVSEDAIVEPVVESLEEAPVQVEETKEETPEVEEVKTGRTYNGKYEIYKENNYYRYRLKASNGEILFESEIYATYKTARSSIDAVKRNIINGKTTIIVDKKKNYKFKLTAANHRVLVISANYNSEKAAQSALESFKRFGQTDDIVDVELPADEIDAQLIELSKEHDEDKKGGKFILKKDANGEFSWEFKPNNGEVLCRASGYSSKNTIDTSVLSFKENVRNGKFYVYCDKNNRYQFKLYSQSGRLSMIGESYDSQEAVQSVVRSILNFIELAVIQDKTNPSVKTTKTVTKTTTKTTTVVK